MPESEASFEHHRPRLRAVVLGVLGWAAVLALPSCYRLRNAEGGGEVDVDDVKGPRRIRISDIAVHPGYDIQVVAHGLTFPSGIAFDEKGQAYVIEAGYSYGEVITEARLLQLAPDGAHRAIATSKAGITLKEMREALDARGIAVKALSTISEMLGRLGLTHKKRA